MRHPCVWSQTVTSSWGTRVSTIRTNGDAVVALPNGDGVVLFVVDLQKLVLLGGRRNLIVLSADQIVDPFPK